MSRYDLLWKKSKVPPILNIFSQEVKRYLQITAPQSLEYAVTYLPFTLWRWYYLLMENEQITPYMNVELYR